MSHPPITTPLFNIITVSRDHTNSDQPDAQEVVNYCEARFRVILQVMQTAMAADRIWMTKTLYWELVHNANHHLHVLVTICRVLGIMFLAYRSGDCHRSHGQHSDRRP